MDHLWATHSLQKTAHCHPWAVHPSSIYKGLSALWILHVGPSGRQDASSETALLRLMLRRLCSTDFCPFALETGNRYNVGTTAGPVISSDSAQITMCGRWKAIGTIQMKCPKVLFHWEQGQLIFQDDRFLALATLSYNVGLQLLCNEANSL